MDINIELLDSLTDKDIQCINDLRELLVTATKYANAIKKYYKFSIGETKKTVWSDSCNTEYLTIEGVWQARYLNQKYDVTCTREGIFKVLKEKYLVQNRLKDNGGFVNPIADSASYFKSFAKRTIREVEKES